MCHGNKGDTFHMEMGEFLDVKYENILKENLRSD
jgi:hypothetical protein